MDIQSVVKMYRIKTKDCIVFDYMKSELGNLSLSKNGTNFPINIIPILIDHLKLPVMFYDNYTDSYFTAISITKI